MTLELPVATEEAIALATARPWGTDENG